MQVFATLLIASVLAGVRAVIRTPLEAFRPSGEIHIRRPDKLPLLPHKRTAQPKSGLKILYQTGVSILNISNFYRLCFVNFYGSWYILCDSQYRNIALDLCCNLHHCDLIFYLSLTKSLLCINLKWPFLD